MMQLVAEKPGRWVGNPALSHERRACLDIAAIGAFAPEPHLRAATAVAKPTLALLLLLEPYTLSTCTARADADRNALTVRAAPDPKLDKNHKVHPAPPEAARTDDERLLVVHD